MFHQVLCRHIEIFRRQKDLGLLLLGSQILGLLHFFFGLVHGLAKFSHVVFHSLASRDYVSYEFTFGLIGGTSAEISAE